MNALTAIVPEVRQMLEEHKLHHSCIDSAALLTHVLHATGFRDAYRLTVNVRIINEAYRKYVETYGEPTNEATGKACDDAGGARINLGKDSEDLGEVPEGNWPGHLTVIVPKAFGDRHALIDPSITQANWPEYGIVLPPVCLKVTDDFVAGQRPAPFEVNKTLLIYDAYPKDDSYNRDGDCMNKDGIETAVAIVLKRLKKYLG